MPLLLQVAPLCVITAYFVQCRGYMHRRSIQSWESLVGQIRSGSELGDLSNPSLSQDDFVLLTDRLRKGPREWRDLWSLFKTARLTLEIADFVERNVSPSPADIDPFFLKSLREDAMQVRVSALFTIASIALPRSTR